MKGRGAGHNPANRFERLELDWEVPPPEKVPTQYLVDSSRSIISTNASPDVGFNASLNPYRGCSHGCSYCLDGATRILMTDGTTRSLATLRPGDKIYGTIRRGHYRRYTRTRVLAHWNTRQPAYRIELADGTELIAGPNHRFLTERGWKYVADTQQGHGRRPRLTTNNKLLGTGTSRKSVIEGQALKSAADLRVVVIEPLGGNRKLYDIETGTGDFIANGVVSHNCYARNTHEYLGFSAGLDFESKILVKPDAPQLLCQALASPTWQPQPLALSGVTDPYQPVEKKLEITRGCLEVLAEARNPTMLITKNRLITRDLDLLSQLNRYQAVSAALSIPTLNGELARVMEPQASHPRDRLRAIAELSEAGIPTSVMIAPVIPGLTDHELPKILAAAAEAGAGRAGYVLLKLPGAVEEIFLAWLNEHFPERKAKVLARIRAFRDGALNQSDFAVRGRGSSALAREFADFFAIHRRRHGLDRSRLELSPDHFRRPVTGQRSLFD